MVEPLTAGIIPHQVDGPYSNIIMHDLAGHHEYFSSHSACQEAISSNSPATFLLLQDLRKDSEAITKELYWSTMIDGMRNKCHQKSSVIVVGTHADQLTPQKGCRKLNQIQSVAKAAISHQKLVRFVSLNLTKMYMDEIDQVMSLLHETNKEDMIRCPSHCHRMLSFFHEKLPPGIDALSLADLIIYLISDPDKVICPDVTCMIPILKTLSDKGLIVYIPSADPMNSWIILDTESILKMVNTTLFADSSFKEYALIASNTGIIPRAILEKTLPEYNDITQRMIDFELCQVVEGSPSPDFDLIFFPALVYDRPSGATVPSKRFGWSVVVKSPYQFLTPRFLHVYHRRQPFEFALPTIPATPIHSYISHRQDVWSRDMKWLSEEGVDSIVEMVKAFQPISMTMSSADRTNSKYRELSQSHLFLELVPQLKG